MTRYNDLTEFEKKKVDKEILETFEDVEKVNKRTGFKWNDLKYHQDEIHSGNYCADCFCVWYNCLCSHDN